MALTRDDMREIYLSGTVHFPPKPPTLAEMSIQEYDFNGPKRKVLVSEETHDADDSVIVIRYVLLDDVAAIFLPDNQQRVILYQGEWRIGPEVHNEPVTDNFGKGIFYVREHVGMRVVTGANAPSKSSAGEAFERHQSLLAYLGCC